VKGIRVFARGLRSKYMEAAAALLAGPLAPCRLWAKLDRWRDAVAPFMAGAAPGRGGWGGWGRWGRWGQWRALTAAS
jgi:hypothetical protein